MTKNNKNILIYIVYIITFYVLYLISKYWYADILYNKGKNLNSIGNPMVAVSYLTNAQNLQKNQAIYKNELAISYALLAKTDSKYISMADSEIKKAVELEPNNINIVRSEFGIYVRLSEFDQNYLLDAKKTLDKAILMAPTDPKLFYNLGLLYARVGQNEKALKLLDKAIELKPNYQEPKNAIKILNEAK